MDELRQFVKRAEFSTLIMPIFNIQQALRSGKVVLLSDTHAKHRHLYTIPDGDTLICSGDILGAQTRESLYSFIEWFERFPHSIKILVAGNHDGVFVGRDPITEKPLSFTPQQSRQMCANAGILYLENQQLNLNGLRIYGTPCQPDYKNMAFNVKDPEERRRIFRQIPEVDILITHVPARGILDLSENGENCGCEVLREEVQRIKPQLHVSGHIHVAYGVERHGNTTHVNASIVDGKMEPVNKPVVYELKV